MSIKRERLALDGLPRTAAVAAMSAILALAGGHHAGAVAPAISWVDPLGYQKPQPIAVAMPDEASVANKYYVDFSSGAGTACSAASPCKGLGSLVGKPGIAGGPAYVYVRGTGQFWLYNDTFYGAPGREIVIKPWGTATAFSKNSAGNASGGTISGPAVHHIIIDGGPTLAIKFVNDTAADNYALHIEADDITVYRTESYCTQGNVSGTFGVGGFRVVSNGRFINNEMHHCGETAAGQQASAIYVGPGAGGGYANFLIQNNIIRSFGGEGLEINPRVTSSNMTITGNAMHDLGKSTCSSSWQCRPAITMSVQSGNGNNATVITNNVMWDIGSGCIWDRGHGTPVPVIYNNTCYDYGKGSGAGGPVPEGIAGFSNDGTATIRNNIIYAPNGTKPFDASAFTASNNVCAPGQWCGSSSRVWSSTTMLSTDPASNTFMRPAGGSVTIGAGVAVGSVTIDYAGNARPPYDIGAFAFGSAPGIAPAAPTNVRVR